MWQRVAADMSTRLVSHRRPRRRIRAANDRNRVRRHRRRLPMMMTHLVAVPRLHLHQMTTRRVMMTIRVRTPIPSRILHPMMIHRPIRMIPHLLMTMILQMIRTLLPLRHRRLMRIRVKRDTRRNPVIIKQVRIESIPTKLLLHYLFNYI